MRPGWLALSAVLLAFYGVVAHSVLHPKVSNPYRDYYISRSTRLSPLMLESLLKRLKPIQPGEINLSSDDGALVFESGWSDSELGHRWSSANYAKIAFLWTPELKGLRGKLILEGGALSGQRMSVQLNHEIVYQGALLSPDFRVEMTYDPSSLKNGINEIIFHLPDARPPGIEDKRTLSLDFRQLKIF